MDTCPYYHKHGVPPDAIACCNHKHAPVPCFGDTPPDAPARLLKCGGRLSRCEIPANQQLDPS
jgi:hypothetical protein